MSIYVAFVGASLNMDEFVDISFWWKIYLKNTIKLYQGLL